MMHGFSLRAPSLHRARFLLPAFVLCLRDCCAAPLHANLNEVHLAGTHAMHTKYITKLMNTVGPGRLDVCSSTPSMYPGGHHGGTRKRADMHEHGAFDGIRWVLREPRVRLNTPEFSSMAKCKCLNRFRCQLHAHISALNVNRNWINNIKCEMRNLTINTFLLLIDAINYSTNSLDFLLSYSFVRAHAPSMPRAVNVLSLMQAFRFSMWRQ